MKILYNGKTYDVVQEYKNLIGEKEYAVRLDKETFLLINESDCKVLN